MNDAGALDRNDPLARFRDEFVHEEGGPLYVDGNSLGRLPKRTEAAIAEVVERWGTDLVRGWHEWIELPTEVGDELAEHALGARPGEVAVTDSVTVNLYKLASAVLAARPDKRVVVTDLDNFPTDRYVLEGVADDLRFVEPDPVEGPTVADVEAACASGDVGLVALSHVAYRPGALADLRGITEVAHAAGALMLWDVSHAVGAVEIGLEEHGVDLAVGCTYKYLNAGPGAPAFLYVREPLQEELRTPIQGWFGQRDQFAMGHPYEPADGVSKFLAGSPQILGLVAIRASLEPRRGRDRDGRGEGPRAHRLRRRAPRRATRATRRRAGHAARRGEARRTRLLPAPGGLAHLPRPHRAGGRDPRLPRPRQRPLRLPAAVHPLRRRPRVDRATPGVIEREEYLEVDAAFTRVT